METPASLQQSKRFIFSKHWCENQVCLTLVIIKGDQEIIPALPYQFYAAEDRLY